jgi:hypothetical protein
VLIDKEIFNTALTEEHEMNSLTGCLRVVMGLILMAAMTAMIFTAPAQAQSAAPTDEWKFSVTPYLWLPNINGTLKYDIPPGAGGSPDVKVGPNDYLQNLQSIILLSGEVRKARWSMFTDVIYLAFTNEESKVQSVNFGGSLVSSSLNLATSSSLRGTAWTLGAGYAVQTGPAMTVDVFGGLRYFSLQASTGWQLVTDVTVTGGGGLTFPRTGGISAGADLWDGIIGVRGRIPLGSSHWSLPYYLDIGAGSSQMTYQWLLGIAYSFKWGEVTLAYRDLYYDQSDDKLVQNLRFDGPALGATFRF